MENKSHALAAGSFVLALLTLLVGLAVWLTRDTRQQRAFELSSGESVTGLQRQASVRFKGVNVGKVTAIGFDPETAGNVLIRIAVDDAAPITESTFATLGFQGVTGLAFVQLDDDGRSKTAPPVGDGTPVRIPLRPSRLSSLSDQGVSLLSKLEETSSQMNALLAPANQAVLISAIGELGQTAKGIGQLSVQTSRTLPRLTQEAIVTLKALQSTASRISESADEAGKSAQALRKVTDRLNEKGGTLDQLSRGVNTLVAAGHGVSAITLPGVNRAVGDAAAAARQANRTAESINDNPQSLIFGNAPIPPGPGETGFHDGTPRP